MSCQVVSSSRLYHKQLHAQMALNGTVGTVTLENVSVLQHGLLRQIHAVIAGRCNALAHLFCSAELMHHNNYKPEVARAVICTHLYHPRFTSLVRAKYSSHRSSNRRLANLTPCSHPAALELPFGVVPFRERLPQASCCPTAR